MCATLSVTLDCTLFSCLDDGARNLLVRRWAATKVLLLVLNPVQSRRKAPATKRELRVSKNSTPVLACTGATGQLAVKRSTKSLQCRWTEIVKRASAIARRLLGTDNDVATTLSPAAVVHSARRHARPCGLVNGHVAAWQQILFGYSV